MADRTISQAEYEELIKLRSFYRSVAGLTANHQVIADHASVPPNLLGAELEKINPKWWQSVSSRDDSRSVSVAKALTDVRSAIQCLYVAVDQSIADSIKEKFETYRKAVLRGS